MLNAIFLWLFVRMSSGVASASNACIFTGDAEKYSDLSSENYLASENKCKRKQIDISRIEGTMGVP